MSNLKVTIDDISYVINNAASADVASEDSETDVAGELSDSVQYVLEKASPLSRVIYIIIRVRGGYIVVKITIVKRKKKMDVDVRKVEAPSNLKHSSIRQYFGTKGEVLHDVKEEIYDKKLQDGVSEFRIRIERTEDVATDLNTAELPLDFAALCVKD
jgi:hypothetical protein